MVSLKDIESAHERIQPFIHRTPVLTNTSLNDETGANLFFKCENFQKAGSFKIRGATNAVELLSNNDFNKGVATTSSGNHGAALSMAVSRRGGTTKVVMPHNTPLIKVNNVKRNGGEVVWCDPDQKYRESVLKEVVDKTGSTVIHPYNDERIMAGQGTCAKELLEDVPKLDAIVSPVSGGGLLSGSLIAAKTMSPSIKVYGAEPKEADDAYRSLKKGSIVANKTIDTICDGLRAQIGTKTFPVIQELVDEIITIDEQEVVESLRMVWERLKIIVEPSCSITLALVLKRKALFEGQNVGLILSGGNVDLNELPW
ncbi:MAG: pyridoxal-phosphate dependent enzyme [Candidatus Neomarinimicrobiota bacterium]|nr:pyridoxal-phosphate dependent enzyme [Candidatus Neomarinimicrobiota bacterium]MEC8689543.1 pyridoxal-phosphate dependent enzyme [Candidatus Neomarinimicrobiota bacterium]|tara:strand:+ start:1182 stop:2120 length:939 start_codon:yes stop_codon:yes gene_type:complete